MTPATRGRAPAGSAAFLLALVAALLGGCGAAGKSPGEVVEAALVAANKGDYEEVENYYSGGMKHQMRRGMGLVVGGTEGFAEYYTRSGDLEEVKITSEEIDGKRARVEATLTYTGPLAEGVYFAYGEEEAEESTWELVRESDGWKLTANGIPTK